jgi:hypothetical protein
MKYVVIGYVKLCLNHPGVYIIPSVDKLSEGSFCVLDETSVMAIVCRVVR